MNLITEANIVRDCGGHPTAHALPTRRQWNQMLAKYAPGCGAPTHVVGTNGGTMPCGSELTCFGKTGPYFCPLCENDIKATTPDYPFAHQ